jgi:hypothetical protein
MPVFYLCQTDDGPSLEATRADAKGVDPQFVKVDLPNDKEGLRAGINELLKGLKTGAAEAPVPVSRPVTITDGCPSCNRTPLGAAIVAEGKAAAEVEDAVWATKQPHLLRKIITAAEERFAELEKTNAAK